MEAKDYLVGPVLRSERYFVVPIYQRRYQWTENELLPFWRDVVAKADEVIEQRSHYHHYMGALIWVPTGDGLTTKLQVVDGQQRLTTFQLLLSALGEVAEQRDHLDLKREIDNYLFNPAPNGSADLAERVKLLPTPADRSLIHDILCCDREAIRRRHPDYYYQNGKIRGGVTPRALLNYLTLIDLIDNYARYGLADTSKLDPGDEPDGDNDPALGQQRLTAVKDALLNHMKLVVISLGEGDDAQVIFETLNSKGKPLLAMDLVRNNIFHRAEAQGEEPTQLYRKVWSTFEGSFWEQPAPRARPVRPRMDHFLSHALTAQTGRLTAMRELYAEYRGFARPAGKSRFGRVEDELRSLTRFAAPYRVLEGDTLEKTSLAWFGEKLAAWESTIAYPVAFQAAIADIEPTEAADIYRTLYAYIVRRAVCGLPNKSLGNVFARLASRFLECQPSHMELTQFFAEQSAAATTRFPGDDEFSRTLIENPLYSWFSGFRLPDLLWELEQASRGRFTEAIPRPPDLWVEHILPQTWTAEWPDERGLQVSRSNVEGFSRRNKIIHTLGNLTLTTDRLNISLGNESFEKKAEKLRRESLLVLNRDIAGKARWTEDEIGVRSKQLAGLACDIWPSPHKNDASTGSIGRVA